MNYTVSELITNIKSKFSNDIELNNITITGEITNYYPKKEYVHLYFSLKDNKSAIDCMVFGSNASKLSFKPSNGDKVIAKGSVSIYEQTGRMQFYITAMKKEGEGDLLAKYEELKKKLTNEGYFDNSHKKIYNINYPNNIAVIVGDSSAAMSDIKRTFNRRWPLCNVDYYPSIVQGKEAANSIIKNLNIIDNKNYDAIIIARGGGSFEDLFCFNDERLIKTIYNLNTFTISGIGHEQDFTLCDFVCDKRASTPTATVELLTKDIKDVIQDLDEKYNLLNIYINKQMKKYINQIESYNIKFKNYNNKFILINNKLESYKIRLKNNENKFNIINNNLINNKNKLFTLINIKINNNKKYLDSKNNELKAYSIDNTLKRGFSIIYKDNKIIKNKKDVKKDDLIDIKLYKSIIKAIIKEK